MTSSPQQRRFLGKTLQERQHERRARLVTAGLEEFGQRGFHDVGVRDVCRRAHLTERYFYESFANREALFLAVYEDCVARVREATVDALACGGDDAGRVVRAALGAFFGAVADEPGMARVLLIDVLTVSAEVARESQQVMQRLGELVGSVVAQRYPGLSEAGLHPHLLVNGLLGATVHIAMQWVLGGLAESRQTVVDHAAILFEAVAAAVPGGPSGAGACVHPDR